MNTVVKPASRDCMLFNPRWEFITVTRLPYLLCGNPTRLDSGGSIIPVLDTTTCCRASLAAEPLVLPMPPHTYVVCAVSSVGYAEFVWVITDCNGELYTAPLYNMSHRGTMCLGGGYPRTYPLPPEKVADDVIRHLNNSMWNADYAWLQPHWWWRWDSKTLMHCPSKDWEPRLKQVHDLLEFYPELGAAKFRAVVREMITEWPHTFGDQL